MRSRTARLTVGLVAWLAIGAAAFFLVRSDKQITDLRAAVRAFDLHAREAADAVADLRVAEQAYVAEGQGVAFWMPKVAATSESISQAIASLRQSADSTTARTALDEAADAITEFRAVDKRARDYIKAGQQLMAGDVIFTEGGETASGAARQIERARLAEHQLLDRSESMLQREQVLALAVAAGLAALVVLALIPGAPAKSAIDTAPSLEPSAAPAELAQPPTDLSLRLDSIESHSTVHRVSPVLSTAALLCTDFSRLRDVSELQALLGRAADAMDATGMVVWLGSEAGADLRPVLTHGYGPQALARMPSVARSDDNAAAAAYRTGTLQLVHSRPGVTTGAIVAPILAGGGCVGALSAEIRGGGEASESVQALAAIVAAQLSTVLAAAPPEAEQRAAGGAGI
jgi:hypothetical protein